MKSGIYDDLKKSSAKIEPKRLVVNAPMVIVNNTPMVVVKNNVNQNTSEKSINDIILMIPPDLHVLRDSQGFVHDSATIAIRCGKGHLHRYFIDSVAAGNLKCQTCKHTNKFAVNVRETAEDIFKVPFIISPEKITEYPNVI